MKPRRRELLESLFHELFQTETSASAHPMREARRLGDVPPAHALRCVAEHATRKKAELPELAHAAGLPDSTVGRSLGAMFSRARQLAADYLVDAERSYRGTLLGMRHGVDLVKLLREVADREGIDVVVEWCDDWLSSRIPLIECVAERLAWFADQPARALRHGGRPRTARELAPAGTRDAAR